MGDNMVNKGKQWYGYARVAVQGYSAVSAGSSAEYGFFAAPFKCKIIKCSIIPDSTITGANTNNCVLSFVNKGSSGTGTSTIASKTFSSGVNASEYDETDLGAVSNNLLNEGDVVTFKKSENGTGMTMPALTAKIEYVRV